MKRLAFVIGIMLIAVTAIAGNITDATIYQAHDSSPAIRVKNDGTETATFTIYGDSNATNRIVIGSVVTVLDMSGVDIDTIAELAAAINAATNSAGETPLTADTKCAAADSEAVDDELMIAAEVIYGGDNGDAFLWDTSDTKHYRLYVPPSGKGQSRKGVLVKSVSMNAGGTGNITVKAYLDQEEKFSKIFVSPVYIPDATASGTNMLMRTDEVGPANLSVDLGMYIGISQGYLLSIDRATTGTTGGAMLRLEYE